MAGPIQFAARELSNWQLRGQSKQTISVGLLCVCDIPYQRDVLEYAYCNHDRHIHSNYRKLSSECLEVADQDICGLHLCNYAATQVR